MFDQETEVLTKSGFKLFKDINQSFDKIATINPDNLSLSFENCEKIIEKDYSREMIIGKTNGGCYKQFDFKITPNHSFSKAIINYNGNNKEKEEFYTLKGTEHKTKKEQRPDLKIKIKDWLHFLGIYLAEGTMCKEKGVYKIQLAAFKDRERNFIINVLKNLNVNPCLNIKDRITFENKRIYKTLENYGLKYLKAPFKFVPPFVFDLGKENIQEFLLGHFMGDGTKYKNGNKVHYTSSIKLANDLQILLFLSGQDSSLKIRPPRKAKMKDGRIIKSNFHEHRIAVLKNKPTIIQEKYLKKESYQGKVYCFKSLSDKYLITRRNYNILIFRDCES